MKVSIILPVYNGEETLEECLDAIKDIDYPKKDYELVVVNDGSSDNTKNIINKKINLFKKSGIAVNFIDLKTNQGRIKARLTGVKQAKNDKILFVDHRCILKSDILKKIEKINYEPLIGNPYQDPQISISSRFFYIIRKLLYKPYWGKDFPKVYITDKNFDKIPKGFCPFFCDKKRFLEALPKNKGKWINDDTLILSKIVKNKNILKISEVKCLYLERTEIREVIWHIFTRGPKFVNFYKNPKSKYFYVIPITILTIPLLVFFLWITAPYGLYTLLTVFLLSIPILSILRYGIIDIISIYLVGPLVFLSFSAGLFFGVIKEIFKTDKL